MRRLTLRIAPMLAALGAATLLSASAAQAAGPAVKHLKLKAGPFKIIPGQNVIDVAGGVPKPKEDGYVVSFDPDIHYVGKNGKLGKVPAVDVIHLHHGVWLSIGGDGNGQGVGPAQIFAAAGEEKTKMQMPPGYGYVFKKNHSWLLNYMIHNLTDAPTKVWITYDVDFVPATSPAAQKIKPARPIWMDVMSGSIYPVFDVHKGSGKNGRFTFPTDAKDPYGPRAHRARRSGGLENRTGGRRRNEWTVDRDGTLIWTAGHLHPGGFHNDLYVRRPGASATPGSKAAGSVRGDTAHLFRSTAKYWEPAGAVSWDVAMTATPRDWKVNVKKGDTLVTTATYDSKRASWYESMGIMVVFMADGHQGANPFKTKVDRPGKLTHGHLPENDNHGGEKLAFSSNPMTMSSGSAATLVGIKDFVYQRGSFLLGRRPPVVKRGSSLTFFNRDDSPTTPVWHTITACKAPCNRQTGIAYPLADSSVQFDSGQLGLNGGKFFGGRSGPPTAGRLTWKTPKNLKAGTYTYFCRVHPFMRGAFRVKA